MGRYCIICKTIFGCVKERVTYVCSDCRDLGRCGLRLDVVMSHVTGGICETCWQSRRALKAAINV